MAKKNTAPTKEIGRPGLTNVGGGLLPWSIFVDDREFAPDLRWTGGSSGSTAVYRRMSTDAQLKGLMLATTLPITRFRWELDPNGAKPNVLAHIGASLNLGVIGEEAGPQRRRNRFDFARFQRYALQALVYGHYHFEEVYEYRDPREGGDGLLHLRKLGTRPPRTLLDIATEDDGTLGGIQQNVLVDGGMAKAGYAGFGPVIEADRLLAFVWDPADEGDHVGSSMFRACYRDWLIKDALIRVDATKHQRNGMGVPWFEVDANASKEQVEELAKVAERWRAGEASGGAGPGKLTLKGVDGATPDTIGSIRYHDQQMSRAFLLLFYDLGTTQTGSRALGGDFIDWYADAQDGIADWFRNTAQQQIEREVELNWGPDEQPPLLSYQRMEATEMSLQDLVSAASAGLIALDDELGSYLTQRWHLPKDAGAIKAAAPELGAAVEPAKPIPPAQQESPPAGAQSKRSAIASALTQAITSPMRWPDAARAVGVSPKDGTARRARDRLITAGAIERRPDGMLAPVPDAGIQVGDRELRREPLQFEVDAAVDFAAMEEVYTSGRDTLLAAVRAAQGAQIDELAESVEAAAGDASALASLSVEPVPTELIEEHLLEIAAAGVASAREEREAQLGPSASKGGDAREGTSPLRASGGSGSSISAAPETLPTAAAEPEADQAAIDTRIAAEAAAVALTLAGGLAASASKRATMLRELPPAEAASLTRDFLEGLKGAALEEQIGGAVTHSYGIGRQEFMRSAEPKACWASEALDNNTCSSCSEIDGTQYPNIEASEADYPMGAGFSACEAGLRCRGGIICSY